MLKLQAGNKRRQGEQRNVRAVRKRAQLKEKMKTESGISVRSKGNYNFVKAWKTPPDILKFIKAQLRGHVLNLCCGEALLGDVNVDLYRPGVDVNGNKVIIADVLSPDFDLGEKFDTIVADPPYNWPYHHRAAFNRAVSRHLKPGGRFVLNAPWVPRFFNFAVEEIWVVYKRGGLPANATLLSIATKKVK